MSARVAEIKRRLEALHPASMEIVDESHQHAGHAGAQSGGGHYRLYIVAAEFTGKNKMARHRVIYSALAEMMQRDIHALTIDARAPGEIE